MVHCINLFKEALMPELSSSKCTFYRFLFSNTYVVPLVKKRPTHGEFYGALQKIVLVSNLRKNLLSSFQYVWLDSFRQDMLLFVLLRGVINLLVILF